MGRVRWRWQGEDQYGGGSVGGGRVRVSMGMVSVQEWYGDGQCAGVVWGWSVCRSGMGRSNYKGSTAYNCLKPDGTEQPLLL